MRIVSVVGARPNFMKLAPVDRELAKRREVEHVIVHTGQHYDPEMSEAFFEELRIPAADHHLAVGSGSHAAQTAAVMERLEPVLVQLRPDLVLVYGDVNSTVAAALTAAKLGLPVGNVMIDSLCWALPHALEREVAARQGLREAEYVVVTLHRPPNVDDPATLRTLVEALHCLSRERPVVFPVHPRARTRMDAAGVSVASGGDLRLIAPLGYLDMLGLVASAALVITDSGGLQEETTFLGVPCLTVRPNTERPITCAHGTNRLVPPRRQAILAAADRALARRPPVRPVLERWDGHAAERIVRVACDGERFDVEAADPVKAIAHELTDRAPGQPRRAGMFATREVLT